MSAKQRPSVQTIVAGWAKKLGIDADDILLELEGSGGDLDPTWEAIGEPVFVCEEKYTNRFEQVLRHRKTGRFIRFPVYSLPYGVDDYGHPDAGPEEIEEVFPTVVTRTEYLSREEAKATAK